MLSDNDLELLSAYLDGALNEGERAALEVRLSADADLRRELARLRATVALVKGLPTLTAPRDFTLTPRMVRRPPAILTSAAFSALSAAAAVVLLVVGAALFTSSLRFPANNFAPNPVAMVATNTLSEVQDGLQAGGADASAEALGRTQDETLGILAASPSAVLNFVLTTQQAELPADLQLAAPTGTLEPMLYASAPESATLAEEADDFADTTASDAAANQQASQDGEGQAAQEQASATEFRQASEPSQPPASIASGAAAVQPLPGETELQPPVAAFVTALPAPTIAPPTEKPSATPTLTPTTLPTSTLMPSSTPTLIPSSTLTAIPQPGVFDAPGSANIGIGLIVAALFLLGAAVVTTILRRRA